MKSKRTKANLICSETRIVGNLDADKQERLKEVLKEERRAKEEEAKKKNEEFAAMKRASTFQYGQPRVKLSRTNAPCRVCHQLGHWASDPGNYKFFFPLFSLLFLFLKLRSEFLLECPMRGQNMVTKPAPIASQTTAGAPEASQDQK